MEATSDSCWGCPAPRVEGWPISCQRAALLECVLRLSRSVELFPVGWKSGFPFSPPPSLTGLPLAESELAVGTLRFLCGIQAGHQTR